jgi:hypothetical protein
MADTRKAKQKGISARGAALSLVGLASTAIVSKTFEAINGAVSNFLPEPEFDGNWLENQIPMDPNNFYQENAAVSDADFSLFTKSSFKPVEVWGQLYKRYTNHYLFPPAANVVLKQIRLGDGSGSFENMPFFIVGTKHDGSEVLIFQFRGQGYNTETVYDLPIPLALKKISFTASEQCKPTYIKLFGDYQPVKVNYPKLTRYPFGNQTGVNGFSWSWSHNKSLNKEDLFSERSYQVLKKLGSCRIYLDAKELVQERGKYRFRHNWRGFDLDGLFSRFKADNIFANICLQGSPPYVVETWPADKRKDSFTRPYGTDKDDVSSYIELGKIAFQFAARYGRNKNVDLSLIEADDTQPWYETKSEKLVGLDFIHLMELGNELDKWWEGEEANLLGRQFAYFQSAIYDGHKGALGKNVGIKTADPTMQVTNAGLASSAPDFLMSFVEACAKLRGYNHDGTVNIPVDGYYSFHCYASNGGGQHSEKENRGMCIEQSAVPAQLKKFHEVNYLHLGKRKLVVGESGYDISKNSPLRAEPPKGSGLTPYIWQGVLILRTALFYAKHGLYRNFFFTWKDDGAIDGWQFSSSGITSDSADRKLVLRPSAMYLIQANSFMKDYVWVEQLSESPLVDKWQHGHSVVFSLYYATESNQKGSYALNVPFSKATKYVLNEDGETPTVQTLNVTGGSLNVEVSEKPVFIGRSV